MASPASPLTFISATARAARTTSVRGCAPRAESRTTRWWATSPAGGNVIVDDPKALNAKRPIAPIELTGKMTAPLLGLFGNDDENPTRDQVNRTEAKLKEAGKNYEFHRYDGAGHAFFNYARGPAYRAEATADGWKKVFAFYNKHLAG